MALVADHVARRSVEVLLRGQFASGALIAAPSYPTYRYAWLRDGAFCAHALDAVGEREAASAWHAFARSSVEAHRGLVERAIAGVLNRVELPPDAFPPARYTLDGGLEPHGDEPWPNFQVDGYGLWLWALEQHVGGAGVDRELAATVELVARYLDATWPLPCFSCWEELDGGAHGATYGAVAAGLDAAAHLLEDDRWSSAAERVRRALLDRFVAGGSFIRGPEDSRLDGSLLWLGVPLGVLREDDPLIAATVAAIERDLVGQGGGVYRYLGDTYYGGGQWLLLTSSLAWHHAALVVSIARSRPRSGSARRRSEHGDLTEQVTGHAQEPGMIAPWVERWGSVATPLLWSHAMYLLAETELQR